MNYVDFTKKVATDAGCSQNAAKAWCDQILESLSNAIITEDEVKLHGIGTFSHVKRDKKMGRNPQTGEAIEIPPATALKFKALQSLKYTVKNAAAE